MTATTPPPLRTAEQDVNYLSLNRTSIVLYAGTPDETEVHVVADSDIPVDLVPPDVKHWDSILKCSDRHDTTLTGLRVAQGKENSLDINRGSSGLTFSGDWGVVGNTGEQVMTIKGGSFTIHLSGTVYSSGTDCDLEIGCWSDQSMEVVHDLDLSGLKHVVGRPLTVVLGRVRQPWKAWIGKAPDDIRLPAGAKVLVWGSIQEQLYWWAKRAAVKLGLFR